MPPGRTDTLIRESDLMFGQVIDNEYIRTKFLAERIVLEARAERGLKGRVIRVGNLHLRPIAHMPPFGPGPQWRTTWFQIP